ncbi:hypothetical protein HSHS1_14880 [Helicobacter suis HS1]|nr:hypothetical protein HSHS1_14880 [Helicobacter suis HS1]
MEASAINASARISEGDLEDYEEGHIKGLTHIVEKCHQYGSKIAIQLAHAGRKVELKNTTLLAPSALRFNDRHAMPKEMDKEDIRAVIADFILTKNVARVYLIVVDGVVKKIGGSQAQGGIKKTLEIYRDGGVNGRPSIRSFGIWYFLYHSILAGKNIEFYQLF